ncbi:MAG TPA: DUF4139 domain-containing protein [Anaerolineae bacterium]|nr:DUF4139 domain-containing protein [Anaerolineae bacterium]HIQ04705.1 DUF4139 domain-containing protein [Anaerolineae bacterium]
MKAIRIVFSLLSLSLLAAGALTLGSVMAQDSGVELTVYNSNLALVKDHRALQLKAGVNEVNFTDVAASIDPTSVHFKSLTDPTGTVVLEQNFEYDIVGSSKLLQKYVDQDIEVVTQDGSKYSGKLLSGSGDIILQDKKGAITVLQRDQIRTFSFPALPEGLITRPTLVWLLDAEKAGRHDIELTYLTNNINWQANYVLLLAQDEKSLDLNGWITLDNRSGATYKEAKLKLVAGEISRVRPPTPAPRGGIEYAVKAAAPPQVAEREFFEYHLYEVARPVTVKDNQTKQIEFVSATGVGVEKYYVYDGAEGYYYPSRGPILDPGYGTGSSGKVKTMLEFKTGKENNLDAQLPRGVVRVYKEDVDGSPLLIGEDTIDHTPKGEKVTLFIGQAFDLVGERTQTDFKRIGDKVVEESYRIQLRNRKEKEAVEIRVVEHLNRWTDWEIIKANPAKYTKLDAQTVEWRVQVPAGGEKEVTYTVRYRF